MPITKLLSTFLCLNQNTQQLFVSKPNHSAPFCVQKQITWHLFVQNPNNSALLVPPKTNYSAPFVSNQITEHLFGAQSKLLGTFFLCSDQITQHLFVSIPNCSALFFVSKPNYSAPFCVQTKLLSSFFVSKPNYSAPSCVQTKLLSTFLCQNQITQHLFVPNPDYSDLKSICKKNNPRSGHQYLIVGGLTLFISCTWTCLNFS